MAELNNLLGGDALNRAYDLGQADYTAFRMEALRREQERRIQMEALRRQAMVNIGPGMIWLDEYAAIKPKAKYRVRKVKTGYVGRFQCKETGRVYTLLAAERSAVVRGVEHFVGKWESAVSHLKSAGLKGKELDTPLDVLCPRISDEAQKQCDLELGVRQAENKARALLLMCLDKKQQEQFERDESFQVYIPDHKLNGFPFGDFVIRKESAFNVEHKQSGEKFCVVAKEKVPVYDQMLTQKLLLENEPKRFFETANRTGGGDPFNSMTAFQRYYEMYQRRMFADFRNSL